MNHPYYSGVKDLNEQLTKFQEQYKEKKESNIEESQRTFESDLDDILNMNPGNYR